MNERLQAALAALRLLKEKAKEGLPFPQQDLFVKDPSKYLAALCTRRAGKTNALARRFIETMKTHPNSLCRYIALTRDSAKDIMWPVLTEMNERMELGAELSETNLTMTLPNGAKLKLYGADMKNFVRRLRGAKSPANAVDEAQEFESSHLEDLIDNILTPSILDYSDGWIAMTGTPGPIPRGLFYDVTTNNKGGYSVHKWSLFDNPFLPDPYGFVDDLKRRRGWNDATATYMREYGGYWLLDADSLLIKYKAELNNYAELPVAEWVYILGIDIGLRDSDALAVVGWHERSSSVYLVDEIVTPDQDITTLSEQIERLIRIYNPSKIVMDTGGLGAKIAEELRRRKGLPIHAADKKRKMENVAFLNEWLRLGRFKAKQSSRFASDSMKVQIDWDKSTPDKMALKPGFHSDIIDAVLYAFKESPAFTYQEPMAGPKPGTKAWYDKEVFDMEKAAEEHFERIEQGELNEF